MRRRSPERGNAERAADQDPASSRNSRRLRVYHPICPHQHPIAFQSLRSSHQGSTSGSNNPDLPTPPNTEFQQGPAVPLSHGHNHDLVPYWYNSMIGGEIPITSLHGGNFETPRFQASTSTGIPVYPPPPRTQLRRNPHPSHTLTRNRGIWYDSMNDNEIPWWSHHGRNFETPGYQASTSTGIPVCPLHPRSQLRRNLPPSHTLTRNRYIWYDSMNDNEIPRWSHHGGNFETPGYQRPTTAELQTLFHPIPVNYHFHGYGLTFLRHHPHHHPSRNLVSTQLSVDDYVADQMSRLGFSNWNRQVLPNSQPRSIISLEDVVRFRQESIKRQLNTRTSIRERASAADQGCSTSVESESCSICLGEFEENDVIATLECGHEYHVDCIKTWLEIKNHCPLCKGKGVAWA